MQRPEIEFYQVACPWYHSSSLWQQHVFEHTVFTHSSVVIVAMCDHGV